MEYDILNDLLTQTVDDFFQNPNEKKVVKKPTNSQELKNNSQMGGSGFGYNDQKSSSMIKSGKGLDMERQSNNSFGSKNSGLNYDGKVSRDGSITGGMEQSRQSDSDKISLNSMGIVPNEERGSHASDKEAKQKGSNFQAGKKQISSSTSLSNERGSLKKNYMSEGPEQVKNCTVEDWLKLNAPKLLEESLKRQNLDISIIENRNQDLLAANDLSEEKKRVKNELKRYDTSYNGEYNRYPDRKEKEPMRPLYLYYKRQKQAIGRAPKQNQNYDHLNEQKGGQIQKNEKPGSGSFGTRPDQNDKNKKDQQVDMKNELERLKKVRSELRVKLETYQDDFMKNHNRKIRYRQDIIPVENDYNLYKSLKIKIKEFEGKVQDFDSKKK